MHINLPFLFHLVNTNTPNTAKYLSFVVFSIQQNYLFKDLMAYVNEIILPSFKVSVLGQDVVFYSGTRLGFHNRNDFFLIILILSDETLNRGPVSV